MSPQRQPKSFDAYWDKLFNQEAEKMDLLQSSFSPYVDNGFWGRIFADKHEIQIVTAPRDTGKTAGACQWIERAGYNRRGMVGIYVGLTYGWIEDTLVPEIEARYPGVVWNAHKRRFCFPSGMQLWTFSAEDIRQVKRIRGKKRPDFWIFDEACFFHPDFFAICSPNFRPGVRILIVTTKLAATWVQEMCQVTAPKHPDIYIVFEPQTEDEARPGHLTLEQWKHKRLIQRESMTEAQFERECLNEWGTSDDAVFRHVKEAFDRGAGLVPGIPKMPELPNPKKPSCVLVDYAQEHDYMVVGVCQFLERGALGLWYLARWNKLDHDIYMPKAIGLVKPWKRTVYGVVPDEGGIGHTCSPYWRRAGYKVFPVLFGNTLKDGGFRTVKAKLVHSAALMLERAQIDIAPSQLDPIPKNEISRFISKPGSTPGSTKFEAPSGMFDDCVTILLLAVHGGRLLERKPQMQGRDGDYVANQEVELGF